jgi:alpha-ketoglutarate-dependent taurine dioxygenase
MRLLLYALIFFLFVVFIPVSAVTYNTNSLKLGVEITGIQLQDHINDTALFDRIKEDVLKHRIMVFRNQGTISADSMLKMFERFGEIFHEPYTTQAKYLHNHPRSPAP